MLRGRWQRGVVLALCALAPRAAASTAYYVNDSSTAGDRAFPECPVMGPGVSAAPCGTCDRPCDSPQLAYDANPVGPGDTLYLNTGRYSPDAGQPGLALTDPGKEGQDGAPLVVEGLLDPSGRCARDDAGVPLVLLDGQGTGSVGVFVTVSFVTLKGFGITAMAPSASEPFGSGVRILGSSGAPGPGPTGWVVSGLEIYGLTGAAASPVDVDAWVTSCAGCEVSWNRLHSCPSCNAAIWIQGVPGVRVIGNEIYGNTFLFTGTPAQIFLAGAPSPVVRNNLVYANGGDALGLLGCESAALCGSQVSSSAQVINNTFWRNGLVSTDDDTAEIAIKSGSGGATFRNNLITYGRAPAFYTDGTAFASSDYNGFQALGGDAGFAQVDGMVVGTFQEWQGLGQDLESTEANPLFTSSSDFHLGSTAGWFDSSGALRGDAFTTPFLDLGDPATPIGSQQAPNRGRVNLGAYGGTAEASLTPVTLKLEGGDGQRGAAGSQVAQPLAVAVRFLDGVGAGGVAVAFEVASGDGQVSPAEAVTDEGGVATARLTLGASASTSVRASLPHVLGAGEVAFLATVDPGADAGQDAGQDAGFQGPLEVSCHCGAGGGPAVLAMLLLAAALARRTRRGP